MSAEDARLAAVRAVSGREGLSLEDELTAVAPDGAAWQVTEAGLEGLGAGTCPEVFIVSPLDRGDPDAPRWVADLPGRGWTVLEDDGALAQLIAGCPELPAEAIARLVAINRGPRGAERVLVEDREVEGLLAELAPQVGPADRRLHDREEAGGRRAIEFLGAALKQSPADRLFRLTVARWRVVFDPTGPSLTWERREILSDALLDRYRP